MCKEVYSFLLLVIYFYKIKINRTIIKLSFSSCLVLIILEHISVSKMTKSLLMLEWVTHSWRYVGKLSPNRIYRFSHKKSPSYKIEFGKLSPIYKN